MSNAMSRSKSRWKAALLATVAGAAVSPLAAKASMTVGVYLNPIGTGVQSLKYLTPDNTGTTVPLYVYAIVSGTGAVTTTPNGSANVNSMGNFDGLQYLYYNLLAQGGNSAGLTGGISATTLNSTLGFDSQGTDQGSSNTSGGAGAQAGLVNLTPGTSLGNASTGPVVAVGATSALSATAPISSSAMTQFAKPRAGGPVWSNYGVVNGSGYTSYADGTNIIIGNGSNGVPVNSVAFLVEKFNYTPSAFNASSPTATKSATFSIGAPFNSGGGSILSSSSYAPSNSFNDSSQSYTTYNSASGSSIAKLTSTVYTSGHTLTLTDTLMGDATGDGTVGASDLGLVLGHFGLMDTKWSDGNFLYYSNSADTTINASDLGLVLGNFGLSAGPLPSVMVADSELLADPEAVALLEAAGVTPVSAVPEPVSLGAVGLLAVAGLGRRRRR
jgi:hypothetical protein